MKKVARWHFAHVLFTFTQWSNLQIDPVQLCLIRISYWSVKLKICELSQIVYQQTLKRKFR